MMHIRHILIICVLTTLTSDTKADTATCQYSKNLIKINSEQYNEYTCELSVGNPNNFVTLTDIDGDHIDNNSDDDVKFLIFKPNINLQTFSPIFCERFPNLEAIKIDNSKINKIAAESLQGCPKLKLLHLNNNNLREIPENLFSENTELLEIMITSNQLNSLPQDTFEMQESLKILSLKNNKIKFLPDKIFVALISLKNLNLDQNQLKVLKLQWFKELESLERLSIISNEIADLPEGVFSSLINLETLILRSNLLTVIKSKSFASSTKIKNIELSYNQIDAIDTKFVQNSQIHVIFMHNNICFHTKSSVKSLINTVLANCFKNYESRFNNGPAPTSRGPTRSTTTTTTTTRRPPARPTQPTIPPASELNNGKLFARGTYPWIAAIMNRNGEYYCGGVLVSSRKIVTSAKCLHNYVSSRFQQMSKDDFSIILGSHDLTNPSERGRTIPTVSDIKIHPTFKIDKIKTNDIAVIVLAARVSFTRFVKSINLMDEGSDESEITNGTVASYGYKNNRKLTAKSAPKELKTSILDSVSCLIGYNAFVHTSGAETFCINETLSDRVCIEDIGSGLFVKHESEFYLRGILSSVVTKDVNLCDDQTLSIYTDVVKFTDWIRSIPEATIQQASNFDDRPVW
ncbi:hypothetical protein ACKWTF_014242 [Chironomus riparius]